MIRAARALAIGLALLSVSGCCWTQLARGPETLVVVVPSRHDGHVGTVVVGHGGQRQVLDSAYAAVRLAANGKLKRTELKADEIQQIFASASEALPRKAASFTLFFALGTPELTAESRATLAQITAELEERPAAEIVVAGHTDRMGTPDSNEALSLRRAQRMREILIRQGIPSELIHAVGMGEREPLVETEDGVAEARNRRVEIIVR